MRSPETVKPAVTEAADALTASRQRLDALARGIQSDPALQAAARTGAEQQQGSYGDFAKDAQAQLASLAPDDADARGAVLRTMGYATVNRRNQAA